MRALKELHSRAKTVGFDDVEHYVFPSHGRDKKIDGRHTALTSLAEKGQPDWAIQAQIGHVSPAMMRTYSHIRRKALDEAAAALEPMFKLVFPPDRRGLKPALYGDKAKKPTSHETCNKAMSQFTSQWDDLKKEIRPHWTAPPKAARETESDGAVTGCLGKNCSLIVHGSTSRPGFVRANA